MSYDEYLPIQFTDIEVFINNNNVYLLIELNTYHNYYT